MALNPNQGGDSHSWNYSKPDNDGYSTNLTGTVVAIQEVQAMNFGTDGRPSTPQFWENNNQPKWNIRIVLCGPSGGFRTLTFTPASKAAKEGKIKSLHMDLFALTGNTVMTNLYGKTIEISTVAPPVGFGYGKGNMRPWTVVERPDIGPFNLSEPLPAEYLVPQLLANQAVSGGVMQPQVAQTVVSATPEQLNPEPAVASVTAPPEDDIPF